MSKDLVLAMTKQCLEDIKNGVITEEETKRILKEEGFDWYELKTAYQNLVKLTKIIKG